MFTSALARPPSRLLRKTPTICGYDWGSNDLLAYNLPLCLPGPVWAGAPGQYSLQADGAKSLGQLLTAVMSMKGQSDVMPLKDAVAMVQATPPANRS